MLILIRHFFLSKEAVKYTSTTLLQNVMPNMTFLFLYFYQQKTEDFDISKSRIAAYYWSFKVYRIKEIGMYIKQLETTHLFYDHTKEYTH